MKTTKAVRLPTSNNQLMHTSAQIIQKSDAATYTSSLHWVGAYRNMAVKIQVVMTIA